MAGNAAELVRSVSSAGSAAELDAKAEERERIGEELEVINERVRAVRASVSGS